MSAIAEEGARILGFILLRSRARPSEAGGSAALHLFTIDVAPEAQRRGIGAQLMDWAFGEAIRVSAWVLELEVATNNMAAQAFYARFGFRATGTIPGYYTDGLDAISMELLLPREPAGSKRFP